MQIVDALVMTLGIDTSAQKKGATEAQSINAKLKADADKTAKDVAARNKKAADDTARANKDLSQAFSKLRNEAIAFLSVFTLGRGLVDFATSTLNSAATLGRMSDNLQMSTEDLSSWQRAADRAGGSAQGITQQLQQAQSEIAKSRVGLSDESMQWFYAYGGKDVQAIKDAKELLLAKSDIIAKLYKVDPGRAQLAASQMGISPEQFNLIKLGSAEILKLIDAQRKNAAVNREQADQLINARNKWEDFKDTLTKTGTQVFIALIPALEKVQVIFQQWADWISAHKEDIAKWIDGAITWIGKFVDALDEAAKAVGGWQNVLLALGALKFLSTIASLVSLASALTGVGGALTLLSSGPVALGLAALTAAVAGGYYGAKYLFGEDEDAAGKAAERGVETAKAPTGKFDKSNVVGLKSKADLKAEAARQMNEAVAWRLSQPGASKAELKAEADRQMREALANAKQGGTSATPAKTAEAVAQLTGMGWTKEQAAGLVANFSRESGLNVGAVGDKGQAYGIGQWHPDRQAAFKAMFGKDIRGSSLTEQLQFANAELRTGSEQKAGQSLAGARTAEEAAALISRQYERPADAAGEAMQRAAKATEILAQVNQANAAQVGQIPAMGANLPGRPGTVSTTTSTTQSETNINGPINVYTQATDADSIAKDMGSSLRKHPLVQQADTGIL